LIRSQRTSTWETHDKPAAVPFWLRCIWFVLVRCAGTARWPTVAPANHLSAASSNRGRSVTAVDDVVARNSKTRLSTNPRGSNFATRRESEKPLAIRKGDLVRARATVRRLVRRCGRPSSWR
jgi:hypothetical protein